MWGQTGLPGINDDVLFDLPSGKVSIGTVIGYQAWPGIHGNRHEYRILIELVVDERGKPVVIRRLLDELMPTYCEWPRTKRRYE